MSLDAFHEHLDACEQCRTKPFGLCAEGEKRIRAAVGEVQPPPAPAGVRTDEPEELDLDGMVLEDSGFRLIGKALRVGPGLYQVLASFHEMLVRIEVRVTFNVCGNGYLAAVKEAEPFNCCGGNDENPPFHCSDCPTHPWENDPPEACMANPAECPHSIAKRTA